MFPRRRKALATVFPALKSFLVNRRGAIATSAIWSGTVSVPDNSMISTFLNRDAAVFLGVALAGGAILMNNELMTIAAVCTLLRVRHHDLKEIDRLKQRKYGVLQALNSDP